MTLDDSGGESDGHALQQQRQQLRPPQRADSHGGAWRQCRYAPMMEMSLWAPAAVVEAEAEAGAICSTGAADDDSTVVGAHLKGALVAAKSCHPSMGWRGCQHGVGPPSVAEVGAVVVVVAAAVAVAVVVTSHSVD